MGTICQGLIILGEITGEAIFFGGGGAIVGNCYGANYSGGSYPGGNYTVPILNISEILTLLTLNLGINF